MKTIFILDWLINKPIKINVNDSIEFKYWDKIIYIDLEKDDNKKQIGNYIWYKCETNKEWKYINKLKGTSQDIFKKQQEIARKLFKDFKKEFKTRFPSSVPITSRMNFWWDTAYFYFYAEERFEFWTFLTDFRKQINMKFFLFQVWARDRIRMSPETDDIYWPCWHFLCCKSDQTPLPTVENVNIELQDLYYKGIEKLKWRCGKLKCCLNYEKNIYEQESKKFPKKWEMFKYNWCNHECCSFNIMSWDIIAKNIDENEIARLNIKDLQKKEPLKSQPKLPEQPKSPEQPQSDTKQETNNSNNDWASKPIQNRNLNNSITRPNRQVKPRIWDIQKNLNIKLKHKSDSKSNKN